jgi:hypothetical protein
MQNSSDESTNAARVGQSSPRGIHGAGIHRGDVGISHEEGDGAEDNPANAKTEDTQNENRTPPMWA